MWKSGGLVASEVAPSDTCGLEALALPSDISQQSASQLRLGRDWTKRWTIRWRVGGGEVVMPVRDAAGWPRQDSLAHITAAVATTAKPIVAGGSSRG